MTNFEIQIRTFTSLYDTNCVILFLYTNQDIHKLWLYKLCFVYYDVQIRTLSTLFETNFVLFIVFVRLWCILKLWPTFNVIMRLWPILMLWPALKYKSFRSQAYMIETCVKLIIWLCGCDQLWGFDQFWNTIVRLWPNLKYKSVHSHAYKILTSFCLSQAYMIETWVVYYKLIIWLVINCDAQIWNTIQFIHMLIKY